MKLIYDAKTKEKLSICFCVISADKQTQVSSEDYGRDLSSVQILITKEVCRHNIMKYTFIFIEISV